jgi:predicted nucleotidyltransferase
MTLEEIISTLETLKPVIRIQFKAEMKGIFGSVARGEDSGNSDVDILVKFLEGATLLDLSGLGCFLEEKLGRKVDIVSTRALRKEFEPYIQRDLVTI